LVARAGDRLSGPEFTLSGPELTLTGSEFTLSGSEFTLSGPELTPPGAEFTRLTEPIDPPGRPISTQEKPGTRLIEARRSKTHTKDDSGNN
jgi:hypothetical protein